MIPITERADPSAQELLWGRIQRLPMQALVQLVALKSSVSTQKRTPQQRGETTDREMASSDTPPKPRNPVSPAILPGEGVTEAERYLGKLCRSTFLSLWSYPAVFRDQGRPNMKSDGKEVCDLLVVFEDHIIILSDKNCHFGNTGNLELDWARWYRKAILDSARQVYGAERWIRQFPSRLFLDKQCTVRFPIELPDPAKANFHRIVVAHDGARRCQEVLGGSGSLMLDNTLVGDAHLQNPFTVGRIFADKPYVHVLDDTTLRLIMGTADTISDFTAYLTQKELFLTGDRAVRAAGDEELLAAYLKDLNSAGEHDFVIKGDYDVIVFDEGFWEKFTQSPERKAQAERDAISYAWDELIEKFAFHAMTGTQYFSSGRPLHEQEKMFRFMAREPRTRRRLLAISLHEVLQRSVTSSSPWDARLMMPSRTGDPHYVFLVLKRDLKVSDEEYRTMRLNLLSNYCHVTKLKRPAAIDIVGIATEGGSDLRRSEDLIYLNTAEWTKEDYAKARQAEQLGLFEKVSITAGREHEYPVDHTGRERSTSISRNSACPCGSGKRFKRCCGRARFDGAHGRMC